MINRIKEMLASGEEVRLECVDKNSFINADRGCFAIENALIAGSNLLVSGISVHGSIRIKDCHHSIAQYEFKYFRIAEAKQTFDDLIDVAVQAYKDGVLFDMELDESGLSSSQVMCCISASQENIIKAIDEIKSLYMEIFVIESEEDIKRIKLGANIKLITGFDLICKTDADTGVITLFYGHLKGYCSLDIPFLKGATVTQQKGNK